MADYKSMGLGSDFDKDMDNLQDALSGYKDAMSNLNDLMNGKFDLSGEDFQNMKVTITSFVQTLNFRQRN